MRFLSAKHARWSQVKQNHISTLKMDMGKVEVADTLLNPINMYLEIGPKY